MAELEPSQLFVHNIPVPQAFLDAVAIEKNFRALVRTNLTTDAARPSDPREGMLRINAVTPGNTKLQAYLNGAWRTLLQHIEVDIPAPVKQIVQFDTASDAWTIDHNLGSQPLVQVYDDSFRLLTPVTSANPPTEQWGMGFVPFALLNAAGPQTHGAFVAPVDGFIIAAYLTIAEALTGLPVFSYRPTIGGTNTTGGVISVSGPQATGTAFNSSAITGANKFVAGDTVRIVMQAGNTPPGAGSLSTFLQVRRSDHCFIEHVTENRVTVTHPEAREGFVVLIG